MCRTNTANMRAGSLVPRRECGGGENGADVLMYRTGLCCKRSGSGRSPATLDLAGYAP